MRAIHLIIAAGVVCIGCSGAPRMLGTYEGRRKVDLKPGADPTIGYTLGLVRLQVKENGRATFVNGGIDREGEMEYSDGKAIFVTETIHGMRLERQPADIQKTARIPFTPQKDGTWLFDEEVTLTKKPDL